MPSFLLLLGYGGLITAAVVDNTDMAGIALIISVQFLVSSQILWEIRKAR